MSKDGKRRVRVTRDMLDSCRHHIEQYHSMFVTWSIKAVETQCETGEQREAFRKGVSKIFNELQMTLAQLQEVLGESPESTNELIDRLNTEQYRKLTDKAEIQMYARWVRRSVYDPRMWWTNAKAAMDWVFQWPVHGIIWMVLKFRSVQHGREERKNT